MLDENNVLDVSTKDELFQFVMMRQIFLLFGQKIINTSNADEVFDSINGKEITLPTGKHVKVKLYKDEQQVYISQIHNSLLTYITINIFEGVKRYCNKTNQHSKFTNKNWYLYFYIIRNSISHDMRINFGRIPKKSLPVQYKTAILTFEDAGKPLDSIFFDVHIFWHLTLDLMNFIKEDLE